MKKLLLLLLAVALPVAAAYAATFSYAFRNTPLSSALATLSLDHPELEINFIYDELETYRTSANVDTDDAYTAIRTITGTNPVSVTAQKGRYYVEALQRGKYVYSGTVVDTGREPLPGVTVLLLAPKDSTVVTYGTTDADGRFVIPCDRRKVTGKFSCVGYKSAYMPLQPAETHSVVMHQLPVALKAVNVQSDNMSLSADKHTYLPTSRQKNSSQNAIDLLRRMAIPQLTIAPGATSVTDVFGKTVPVYINYMEATPEDMEGLKLTDVRKVEFIEYPTDPRFKGAEKVLNFIVQQYEYGGYTKASAAATTLNGWSDNANVYSKFTYRRMTYDLTAGANNKNYRHNSNDTEASYTLGSVDNPRTVQRNETADASHEETDRYPVSFRASYATDRFSAVNYLSFTHSAQPLQDMSGRLEIDAMPDKNYSFSRSASSRTNDVYYRGSFWGLAGKTVSLELTPTLAYTRRHNRSAYSTTLSQPIQYDIAEDAFNAGLQFTGRKAFGREHQLRFFATVSRSENKVNYNGATSFIDKITDLFGSALLGYNYNTKRISLMGSAALGVQRYTINGLSENGVYPNASANLRFNITDRSQLSAFANLGLYTPGIGLRSDGIVRSNELLFITGNPALKSIRCLNSNIAYNWYRKNLTLALFGGYNATFNRIAAVFSPYDNGNALLRRFVHNGNYTQGYLGASANWRRLGNSLQLYANVSENLWHSTGIYRTTEPSLDIQLQASYYWRSFSLIAYYISPRAKLTENSNIIIRNRSTHGISAAWGNGVWTVKLDAANIFHRGWLSATWRRDTPLYTERQRYYNASAHSALTLSATYTIGYGRKTNRNNEIAPSSNTSSAIIQ